MAYGFGFLPDLENSKSVYPPSLTSEIASVLSPSDIKSHFHILLPLNRDSSGTRQASRVSLLGIEEEGRTSYQEGGDIQQIHELLSPLLSLRLVTTGMCESQPLPSPRQSINIWTLYNHISLSNSSGSAEQDLIRTTEVQPSATRTACRNTNQCTNTLWTKVGRWFVILLPVSDCSSHPTSVPVQYRT